MKLEKQHREALLSMLEITQGEVRYIKESMELEKNEELLKFREIHLFLDEQRIELIKASLINNEIDF